MPAFAAGSWTQHLGSHYNTMDWADTVRDPGGVGIFFGASSDRQLTTLHGLAAGVSPKQALINPGGLGSGREQAKVSLFMDRMLFDNGQSWKQQLRDKAAAIAAKAPDPGAISWQFGNEINSQRFSQTVHSWDNRGAPGRAHDATIIPFYVEYYLAPGIEALRAATRGHPQHFRVALGSIASYANPAAQQFLHELLSYRVQGLFAPSLAGQRVFELVDTVTVHYIASANGDVWRDALDRLHQQWFGKGRISALWSSEELGIRRAQTGAGAAFSLMIAARYLDWWAGKGMSPAQGKAFLWGTNVGGAGNSGEAGMDYLYRVAGRAALLPGTVRPVLRGSNLEAYTFRVAGTAKMISFIFPHDQRAAATLEQLSLPGVNSSVRIVQTRLFSREGQQTPALTPGRPAAVALPAMSMLVVVFDQ